MIRPENVLKVSLQDVLKMSWRHFRKTSFRRLEKVLKTPWRRIAKTNILVLTKTSSEDVRLRRTHSSWSRRLEDVFKTSSEDEEERRLQDVFIKTNLCWVTIIFYRNLNLQLIQSRIKSRLFGLHGFFEFFRK